MQPRPPTTPFDLGEYALLRVPAEPFDAQLFATCPAEVGQCGEGEVYEVQALQDSQPIGEARRALWFQKQHLACIAAVREPSAHLHWGAGSTVDQALAQALEPHARVTGSGRCGSGAQRGRGRVAHRALGASALCGAKPGRTSGFGWTVAPDGMRDCARCSARVKARRRGR